MKSVSRAPQRGAAALIVVLGLLAAAVLMLWAGHRQALLDQRMAGHQLRSAAAFEAADAGLDWALARLNDPTPIGADCRPDASATATFRLRMQPLATTPACRHDGSGWQCDCAGTGAAALAALAPADAGPAFVLQWRAGPRDGLLDVTATGCSEHAAPCGGTTGGRAGASEAHRMLVARVPALAQLPAAAVSQRGAETPEAFFLARFGLSRRLWAAQTVVHEVVCSSDCESALRTAAAIGIEPPMLHVAGPLALRGPLVLGTPDRPLLLVADGPVTLDGDVAVHGLVHAAGVTLGPAARIRGAVASEAAIVGDATQVTLDAALLRPFVTELGSWVRVPGSWKDF